jgi:aldehyde:ferredoxin oxidoreductase
MIVISGPPGADWTVVHISEDGIAYDPADEIVGSGVYRTAEILHERYGNHIAASIIGPGGEREYLSAGIQNLDRDQVPSRICARGGLGAVMGSKKVKAVVFDATGGKALEPADSAILADLRKVNTRSLLDSDFVQTLTKYGTAANTDITNHLGALPTRNFSSGEFSGADKISGERMYDLIVQRGGNPSHNCMTGCFIRCSNVYPDAVGRTMTSPLEYETIGLLGSNLGIDDLDAIAAMNRELNDIGLDTIEVGAAMGVAAEAELWHFGDKQMAMTLIEEIRDGTDRGRMLASGASRTAEVLGVEHIPAVKRQAMPSYDPRVLNVTGITYATSAQGADHTAGMTLRKHNAGQKAGKLVEQSRAMQIENAALDALGVCLFAGAAIKRSPQMAAELLRACLGRHFSVSVFETLGRDTLSWEHEFNLRAGFMAEDDRIPAWMVNDPLPPTRNTFEIPHSAIDGFFENL